jgi:hypothetical protein
MRALVFALVFANLILLAWAQGYFGSAESPDARRLQQQLNTDKLAIIARGEAKAATVPATAGAAGEKSAAAPPEKPALAAPVAAASDKPAAKAAEKASDKGSEKNDAASVAVAANGKAPAAADPAKPAPRCLQWSDLAAGDADRLDRLLGERFNTARRTRSAAVAGSAGWWVYIPPQASRSDAERKAGELKRLGAPEYFIVQEAGPNRFAISLGIFSSEAAANDRLDDLRSKGVRSARVGERNVAARAASFEVQVAAADADALRQAAAQVVATRPGACVAR